MEQWTITGVQQFPNKIIIHAVNSIITEDGVGALKFQFNFTPPNGEEWEGAPSSRSKESVQMILSGTFDPICMMEASHQLSACNNNFENLIVQMNFFIGQSDENYGDGTA